jgi:hypothetical protein
MRAQIVGHHRARDDALVIAGPDEHRELDFGRGDRGLEDEQAEGHDGDQPKGHQRSTGG